MNKKVWSEDEEIRLSSLYIDENLNIDEIAIIFNKGRRSIISKLVNMGIYKKPEVEKEKSRTVKVMLRDLEEMLDIEIDGFNLNKKSNLIIIVDALKDKLSEV